MLKIPAINAQQAEEDSFASFASWSTRLGIITHGIDCWRSSAHGLGIVAKDRLEAGEELLKIPLPALLTVEQIPSTFRKEHHGITVHGLLASFLAAGGPIIETQYAPWLSTWPSLADFRRSIPLCWQQHDMIDLTEDLLIEADKMKPALLPFPPAISDLDAQVNGTSCGLMEAQKRRITADWRIVSAIRPETQFERYLYFWLIVNTRSFYYENPTVKAHPPRPDLQRYLDAVGLRGDK
ncbi:MAG: hypothetical protein Q9220_005134 [cf. Caloplaca sp. 1 TL-2023]